MPKNLPITTLLDLLEILYLDPFSDHRKTGALVKYYPFVRIEVEEYFDDGHGHSGAFSLVRTSLNPDILQQALSEGYIAGVLKPGYVSRTEFKLTEHGKQELFRLHREAQDAAKKRAAQGGSGTEQINKS